MKEDTLLTKKFCEENKNLIIVRVDKGNTTVIMNL